MESEYKVFFTEENLNIEKLPPECKDGNIEYKFILENNDREKINHLITQMNWRLEQGYNLYDKKFALYVLGVYDNGKIGNITGENISKTIEILKIVAKNCNAHINNIKTVNHPQGQFTILYIESLDKQEYYPLFDF